MSLVGKQIEEFSLQAYKKGESDFITVTDESLKGHWSVLMFYPADFTFVCPTELEDMQDQYAALQEIGVEVYACSADTHFVHKAWADAPDSGIDALEYAMIGDPSHKLIEMFDVLDEDAGLAQRGTFIIDPEGTIQAMEVNADAIGRDASQLVTKIKAAQYVAAHPGEACPAKWKENAATLTPGIDLVGKL